MKVPAAGDSSFCVPVPATVPPAVAASSANSSMDSRICQLEPDLSSSPMRKTRSVRLAIEMSAFNSYSCSAQGSIAEGIMQRGSEPGRHDSALAGQLLHRRFRLRQRHAVNPAIELDGQSLLSPMRQTSDVFEARKLAQRRPQPSRPRLFNLLARTEFKADDRESPHNNEQNDQVGKQVFNEENGHARHRHADGDQRIPEVEGLAPRG